MPRRHELTDAAWATLAPLLPPDPKRGEQWRDHRTVINGILWKLDHGGAVARRAGAVRAVADAATRGCCAGSGTAPGRGSCATSSSTPTRWARWTGR